MSDADELGRKIAGIVAARREAGEYPDDLEAQLDEHFRRVAGLPGGPAVGDLLASTRALRDRPPFHVPAPAESNKLGGAAVHRAVGVAIRGHMSDLVDQLNAFSEAVRDAITAMADTISVSGPRQVHGQLEAMDARLAEMQRTLNRLAVASDSGTPSGDEPAEPA
jgi:hypothetical protein